MCPAVKMHARVVKDGSMVLRMSASLFSKVLGFLIHIDYAVRFITSLPLENNISLCPCLKADVGYAILWV
jgi:hypothetical protein